MALGVFYDGHVQRVLRFTRSSGRRLPAGLAVLVLALGIGVPLYLLFGLGTDGRDLGRPNVAHGLGVAAPPAVTSLPLDPGLNDVAIGFGSVWVSDPSGLRRVDPSSHDVLATIPVASVGASGEIAVGEEALWIAREGGQLGSVGPETNRLTASVVVGETITGVAARGGSVWVVTADESGSHLWVVSPQTNSVVAGPVDLPGEGAGPVVYWKGILWITNTGAGSSLTRVDSSTLTILPTVNQVDGLIGPVTPLDGLVWGLVRDAAVALDAASGSTVASIPVAGSGEIASGDGQLWALIPAGSSSEEFYEPDPGMREKVVELDPVSLRVVPGSEVPLGFSPSTVAVGEGGVWVGDYDQGILWHVIL